jgi:hypothetical protein
MNKMYSTLIFCLLLLAFTCKSDEDIGNEQDYWESFQPFQTNYDSRELAKAAFFSGEAAAVGEIELEEASGLAWSSSNPGFLWTHQDSGNDNRLFLLDSRSGDVVAAYRIHGLENRDWEDIEIAPGGREGPDYLYVGDIGDNDAVYGSYTIYRFEEPLFQESHRGKIIDLEPEVDKIRYHYPGQNHDVETLMVDPHTRDIYLVTKRDANSILYVAPYPQQLNEEFTLIRGGEFSFNAATAGTLSKDGSEILIKTNDQIFYWHRSEGELLIETLARAPMEAPYNPREIQGEAICFDHQGGYYTLSESVNGLSPELYYYGRE